MFRMIPGAIALFSCFAIAQTLAQSPRCTLCHNEPTVLANVLQTRQPPTQDFPILFNLAALESLSPQPSTINPPCGALFSERPQSPFARAQFTIDKQSQTAAAPLTHRPATLLVTVGENCPPCSAWIKTELANFLHAGEIVLIESSPVGPWPRFRYLDSANRPREVTSYITHPTLQTLRRAKQ